MTTVALQNQQAAFTMVFDDRCAVVRRLARLVKGWDRNHTFELIGRNNIDERSDRLLAELDSCPWSLLLVDAQGHRWSGPEAIPIILKNLPFGKIAAVLYTLPGTMWVTRLFYLTVSRASRTRRRYA
ncbi:MAG TPA: DCC1-like thiol-disulfide oxidoreductase family protein [Candidatus Obscuribacterales bacterium]